MRWVEPGRLRLPPSRRDGADLLKLAEQYRRFGLSVVGMPPLEVTEGAGGELMINDGVTRATRVHRYCPTGTTVAVVVIESRPKMVLTGLPTIAERS
jgi:hypothetical protein